MAASAPSSADQQFLDELDKKLWNAADRLRSNLDAAVYKHADLGTIPAARNGSISSNTKGEGDIRRFDRKLCPGLLHPLDAN